MKLWILIRHINEHDPIYDSFDGHVIRAETEARAREMANQKAGDEGRIWLDPDKVQCTELTVDGPEGFQLSDFNAG